ncbi:MAG: chaperonin GroEL [bacterium]|nr:chaperonin GroEL [bacterium]MDZ4241593.1 chaperonin GroEL [Candidatus Omnitrophota bacterium]
MAKDIRYSNEARQAIKTGVDKIAAAVKVTLGPKGRSVVIDRSFGSPTITDDGVTVAKEVELKDKFENVGASLIQEVANKTNEQAGDGTTTATVLAQVMIEEGMRMLKDDDLKHNPVRLRHAISQAVKDVVEALKRMKKDIKTQSEIAQVATIASLDPEVGQLLSEAMKEVGNDGVITVEEGQTIGLEKEVVKGMRFDKGYVSPYMITNADRMEAVWEDPAILVTDQKVSAVSDILPLLESLAQSGKKELVVIADEIEGEALATFIVNKIRGTFSVLAVKAPGFGDRRKELLQDIAALTGGQVVSEELGLKLESAKAEHLGRARKVIATKEHTTIVQGGGDKQKIADRIAQIKKELEVSTSEYDKEKLQERLAKLAGGVGVIKVGAPTETEMKNRKFKIEDALNATRAAVAEGIIPGGGSALVKAVKVLDEKIETLKNEEKAAYEIVRTAIAAPMRVMFQNAGIENSDKLIAQVKEDSGSRGFDLSEVFSGKKDLVDMFAAGIIDPLKVTRLALENAASVAGTLLTTEAVIVDLPEEKKEGPAGGGMPMDY